MKLLAHLLLSLSLLACQGPTGQTPPPSTTTPQNLSLWQQEGYLLQVQDNRGLPLVAKVLVGKQWREDRVFTTDSAGQLWLDPSVWDSTEDLTLDAAGFVRRTYLNLAPQDLLIQLHPLKAQRPFSLSGITTGFGSLERDRWADVSIVAPLIQRHQLISFDLSHMISDQMDTMSVFGRSVSVPSNLSFPRQKERYGWFTITLDKPSYRLPMSEAGVVPVMALHARFPFESTIDKMRAGESMLKVVNDFSITQGALHRIDMGGNNFSQDLAINRIPFSQSLELMSPELRNNEFSLLIALNESSEGFFSSGIRYSETAASQRLNFSANHAHWALAVVTEEVATTNRSQSFSDAISLQLRPLHSTTPWSLLPRISVPQWQNGKLQLKAPQLSSGVHPNGMYLSLTKTNNEMHPDVEIPNQYSQWEFFASTWLEEVELPHSVTGLLTQQNIKWEVMYLGKTENTPTAVGENLLQEASHVSRNTLQF